MRALQIDFVARRSRARLVSYALLLLAVLTLSHLSQRYVERHNELQKWEGKWRALQQAQNKKNTLPAMGKSEWEHLQAELKAANRVIARLSMPWDALFLEIEGSVDEQVTLLAVEPDTEKREVRITAEAKSLTAMLQYTKRVRAIALFKNAYLTTHQVQQQDPQKPVRFLISAQWPDPTN